MNQTKSNTAPANSSNISFAFLLFAILISLTAGIFASPAILDKFKESKGDNTPHQVADAGVKDSKHPEKASENIELPNIVKLATKQWADSGIKIEVAQNSKFNNSVRLTGKVSLNQDRIAHIYPMVEGLVDHVHVTLGQQVNADELMLVIHSREIGKAKLELFQARLQLEMAKVKHGLQEEINNNVKELLAALRNGDTITDIETKFRNRSMGDLRERLLLSYSNYLKSEADVQRLESIGDSGAISSKQLLVARTTRNADLATYQARIEQIQYELTTSQLLSSQAVKQAETEVSVAATSLQILGCSPDEIKNIDPLKQGETISDYQIRAPFKGVVITKDVVLKEQVRPDSLMFSIADLSTVWVTADVYESHVPLLSSLNGKTINIYNQAWPEKTFTAKIFYTGDVMDENTRTISMRAEADNKEQLLKPGMFVNIDLPDQSSAEVIQLPNSAVLDHQGVSFVFVQTGEDEFERRNVEVGSSNGKNLVIRKGIQPGEKVVTAGGFVLKSLLLAGLMGEE